MSKVHPRPQEGKGAHSKVKTEEIDRLKLKENEKEALQEFKRR